jgi:hypothetical protein
MVTTKSHEMTLPAVAGGGWPTQAWFWLEWGSSIAGQSLPAALSCFRVVDSDSIFTVPHSRVTSQQQVPFDFAQGRLSTPQTTALAMIRSGRDDRIEEI